ncbi:MAG: NAD-dependent epimerase/dehydratase family protein [Pseudomonadota bacterium]
MSGVAMVTGGAGFVGRYLVDRLRATGARVRSFDLAAPRHEDDIQGSVTDPGALARATVGVDVVYHLAGIADLWARDPARFDKINGEGTAFAVRAAREAGVKRFVHCSSLTTLVGRQTPVGCSTADETKRLEPADMLGAYPRSKLEAERIVEEAAADGLDAVIVLPTEPLGPGDENLTPPTKMILDFARGATPAYIDCTLNFVPADSLAEGMIAAGAKGRAGERYLLGGENTPMTTLLAEIAEASRTPAPRVKMPYWVALGVGVIDTKLVAAVTGKAPTAPLTGVRLAGRQVEFSSEKAARELGWRADPWRPALQATIKAFRKSGLL